MDDSFDHDSLMAYGDDYVLHFRWVHTYSGVARDNYDTCQTNQGKESAQMTTDRRKSYL